MNPALTPDTEIAPAGQPLTVAPDIASGAQTLKPDFSFNPLIDGGSRQSDLRGNIASGFASVRATAGQALKSSSAAANNLLDRVSGQTAYEQASAALYNDPTHLLTPGQLRGMRTELGYKQNQRIGIDPLPLQRVAAQGAKQVDDLVKSGGSLDLSDAQIKEMAAKIAGADANRAQAADMQRSKITAESLARSSGKTALVGGALSGVVGIGLKTVAAVGDLVTLNKFHLRDKVSVKKIAFVGAAGGATLAAALGGVRALGNKRTERFNGAVDQAHLLAAEYGIRNSLTNHKTRAVQPAVATPEQQAAVVGQQPEVRQAQQPAVAAEQGQPVAAKIEQTKAPEADRQPAAVNAQVAADSIGTVDAGLLKDYHTATGPQKDAAREKMIEQSLAAAQAQQAQLLGGSRLPVAEAQLADMAKPPKTPGQPDKSLNTNMSYN